MDDYGVEIQGQYDLDQINLQIAGEEASASEFISSKVSVRNNVPTNIVTFRELAPGTVPKKLIVVKKGNPQPPGTNQVWSGVMVVKGTSTAVTAYRVSAELAGPGPHGPGGGRPGPHGAGSGPPGSDRSGGGKP